jgi:hypothetical protein
VACIPSGFTAVLSGGGVVAEVAGIQADGALTVAGGAAQTHDGDATIATLNLVDSVSTVTGAGNLTIPAGGRFTWSSGTLSGAGTAVIDAGAVLTMNAVGCCDVRFLGRNLTNNGSATWSGGRWDFNRTSTFQPTVMNNGAFTVDLSAGNLTTYTDACCLPPNQLVSTAAGSSFRIINGSESQRTLQLSALALSIDGRSDTTDPSHLGGRFRLVGTGTTIVAEESISLTGDGLDLGTGNLLTTSAGGAGAHAITVAGHLFGNSKVAVPAGTATFTATADIDVDAVEVGYGFATLTTDTELAVPSLTLNSPATINGTGNVRVPANGQFTWNGGFLLGTGALAVDTFGNLDITNAGCCAGVHTLGRTFTNHGTATWSGGRWDFQRTETFQPQVSNEGSFVVDLTGGDLTTTANDCCLPPVPFESNGPGSQLTITSDTSTARTLTLGGLAVTVDGQLAANDPESEGGRFHITGSGITVVDQESMTLTGDGLDLGTGNTLATGYGGAGAHALIVAGHLTGNSKVAVLGGTADFLSSSEIDVNAVEVGYSFATLTSDVELAVPSLTLNSPATLTGTGNVRVPTGGQFDWHGGYLVGTGSATVDVGGTLTLANGPCCSSLHILGRDVTNNGTLTWSANNWAFQGTDTYQPTLTNYGTFTIDASAGGLETGGSGCCAPDSRLINNGTLTKLGSNNLTLSRVRLLNNGVFMASSGRTITTLVDNLSGGTLTGGTWIVNDGAVLQLPGDVSANAAELRLAGTAVIENPSNASALEGLSSNTGIVRLVDGAAFPLAAALSNSGTLALSATSVLGGASFNQPATGRLEVNIASNGRHAQLVPGGTATLNGTLAIITEPGLPGSTTGLRVIDASGLNGRFLTVVGTDAGNGNTWSVAYDQDNGDVNLNATPTGGGGDASAGERLDAALTDLLAALPGWAAAYDLDSLELPVVRGDLDTAFDVAGAAAGVTNALDGLSGSVADIQDDIAARGCQVLSASGDNIEVRCPFDLGALTVHGDADAFNDATPGLLGNLGSGADLTTADGYTFGAGLKGSLVIGIDATGAYIGRASALQLDVDASGDVDGTADVTGENGVHVGGSATADFAVAVGPDFDGAPIRPDDLATTALVARPAGGTAGADLTFAVGAASLHWHDDWTVDDPITDAPTLEGSFALPGLLDGAGAPALLTLAGTQLVNGWQLDAAQGGATTIGGLPVSGLSLALTLAPGSFAGTGGGAITVDPLGAGVLHDITLDAVSVSADAIDLGGTLALDTLDLGPLHLEGAALSAALHADLPDGPLTVTVHAGGDDIAAAVGPLRCGLPGVTLDVGPDASGPIVAVDGDTTCSVPALGDLEVTVTDLTVAADGAVSGSAARTCADDVTDALSLAGVLPFHVDHVCVEFPDLPNLDSARVTVEGGFDGQAMADAGVPFTPSITAPSTPDCESDVCFTASVDDTGVHPVDLGPITFAFDRLPLGPVLLGGSFTLGGYQGGVFQPDGCGSLRVAGGVDGVDPDLSVAACVVIDAEAHTFDLQGALTLSGTVNDVVELTDATVGFDLALSAEDGKIAVDRFDIDQVTVAALLVHVAGLLDLSVGGDGGAPVTMNLDPGEGENAFVFPDSSVDVHFLVDPLTGWGGGVNDFALDPDLRPVALPGFGVSIVIPPGFGFGFGLPDYLPLSIEAASIDFPHVVENGAFDVSGAILHVSGGLNIVKADDGTPFFPIEAKVQDLGIDVDKLVACGDRLTTAPPSCELPFTDLGGVSMGVAPFELAGMTIGGIVGVGSVDVDGTTVFYLRLTGTFAYGGIGAGLDLVLTQYGPLLAEVQAPLGIPLGPTGFLLSEVSGGVAFGVAPIPEPDPAKPLELLNSETFQELGDFSIDASNIKAHLARIFAHAGGPAATWSSGGVFHLSGHFTHVAAPILDGEVTVAINVGFPASQMDDPADVDVDLLAKGQVEVMGFPTGTAGIHIALGDPLHPAFSFAFSSPPPDSVFRFLIPGSADVGGALVTTGLAEGTAVALRAFFAGVATNASEALTAALDALRADLARDLEDNGDHARPFTRKVVEGVGPAVLATPTALLNRIVQLLSAPDAASIVRDLIVEITASTGHLRARLGTGQAGLRTALDGLLRSILDGITDIFVAPASDALDAFLAVAKPEFSLVGAVQLRLLGIPLGEPDDIVGITLSTDNLEARVTTSLSAWATRLSLFECPPCALLAGHITKGDEVTIIAELPVKGLLRTLLTNVAYRDASLAERQAALPTLDPSDDDWGITVSGGTGAFGMELGVLNGLIVPPGNETFVERHTQRLYEPDRFPEFDTEDETRPVPLQRKAQYDNLVSYGGLILTGTLQVPELLVDPAHVFQRLSAPPPSSPAQLNGWLDQLAHDATHLVVPAYIQQYVPVPGPTVPNVGYIEGEWRGTVLGIDMGHGGLSLTDRGLALNGVMPFGGFNYTLGIEDPQNRGEDTQLEGIQPLLLPRASMDTAVNGGQARRALQDLGVPAVLLPSTTDLSKSRFRAFTPGYSVDSTDALRRLGGVELAARIKVPALLGGAALSYKLAMTTGNDFSGTVTGQNLTGGLIGLSNSTVTMRRIGGVFGGSVSGTASLPAWFAAATGISSAAATGTITSTGGLTLSVTVNGVTYDLVALFQSTLQQIVQRLVDLGVDTVRIVEIVFTTVFTAASHDVAALVSALVGVGRTIPQVIEAVFRKAALVAVAVSELVRVLYLAARTAGSDVAAAVDAVFNGLRLYLYTSPTQAPTLVKAALDGFRAAGLSAVTAAANVLRIGLTTLSGAAADPAGFIKAILQSLQGVTLDVAQLVQALFNQSHTSGVPPATAVTGLFGGVFAYLLTTLGPAVGAVVDGLDLADNITLPDIVADVFQAARGQSATAVQIADIVRALFDAVQHKVAASTTDIAFIVDNLVDGLDRATGISLPTIVQDVFQAAIALMPKSVGAPGAVLALVDAVQDEVATSPTDLTFIVGNVIDGLARASGITLPSAVELTFESTLASVNTSTEVPDTVRALFQGLYEEVATGSDHLAFTIDNLVDGLDLADGISYADIVQFVFESARALVVSATAETVPEVVVDIFDALLHETSLDWAHVVREMVDGLEAAPDFGLTDAVREVFLAADQITTAIFDDIVYELFRSATLRVTATDVPRLFTAFWNGLYPASGETQKTVLRIIVHAADVFTTASYASMAIIMQALDGISFAEMVDAFDVGAIDSVHEIGVALKATTASATQIMQALEDELDVTRVDTARELLRLKYGIRTIIQALINVYEAAYDSVYDTLRAIGFSPSDIGAVICDYFPC